MTAPRDESYEVYLRKTFQAGIVRRPGTFADVLIEQQKHLSPVCSAPQPHDRAEAAARVNPRACRRSFSQRGA